MGAYGQNDALQAEQQQQQQLQLAEQEKQAGNTHFRDKKYQHAIDSYTQSLEHQENAAVLCNRALCHSKLEEYGSAVADATRALELDPTFIKAYYRRGDANFALGKCKLALKDLRSVSELANFGSLIIRPHFFPNAFAFYLLIYASFSYISHQHFLHHYAECQDTLDAAWCLCC
ncbi:hypothetical protein DUNSADRAFT_8747 [Dunaliella salina]|uniref:Serine/threonine-protein kinase BSK1-like TPR repeats domain-containing protein n=1 Tax=Dunaliella salina TaxID=3046 RepID=A0ABQ7GIY6_DUNSA|nr:hypothetical protein DUNSADRAFT_8747 [Dunaliella salina]|eukprot:KAF5834539.1 hypothetical protein DUNSADRAFT_8747 [Dunaliella salina]